VIEFVLAMALPIVSDLRIVGGTCADNPAGIRGSWTRTAEVDFNYGITFAGSARVVARSQDEAYFNCEMQVDVTPPAGYGLRIKRFVMNGKHRTKGESDARAGSYYAAITEHDVQIADMSVSASPKQLGSSEGPWQKVMEDEMSWVSPCGKRVTLEGHLVLTASHDAATGGPLTELMVGATGVGSDFLWGWTFEDCRWLQGRWSSRYETESGQTVTAHLDIDGSHGTYRTAGFTGQLTDMQYSEDGETVMGRWKVGHQSGWIEFSRNARGEFAGSWGREPGVFAGSWDGRR